jgi:hypothetical protein
VRWVVVVVGAGAAAPLLFTTATYARWWWLQRHAPRGERLSMVWRCAAIVRESLALTMTLATFRGAPLTPGGVPPRTGPAVALVSAGSLGAWALRPLARRLDEHGWLPVEFRPARWDASLEDGGAQLHAFIRGLHPFTPVTTLIAFGRAGVLVRYCLRRYAVTGVRQVFTLATPHQGTEATLPWSASAQALRPRSPFMQHLATGDRVPQQFDVIAITSDFDAFIAPSSGAYYPGAFNIEVRGLGHFALARSARVWELIRENLTEVTGNQ